MTWRRGILVGVLLLLAGMMTAGTWLLLGDPVHPWAAGRLRTGMSEPDVEAILGRPADRAYHPWDVAVFMPPAPGTSPEWEKAWVGQEWVILVHFDENGKVIKSGCGDKDFDNPPPPTASRRLWWLLGW